MAAGRWTPPRRPVRFAAFTLVALSCAGPGIVTHAQTAEPPAMSAPAPAPASGPGEAAAAAAIQATLAVAQHLLQEGRPVDAFAVLIETMDTLPEGTDDAALRFAIAQALMAGGRLVQAELVLARLVEERPDNLRVRLDRAAVLFELGRHDEAGELFRAVRRAPDLPADTRRQVEGYLGRILDRQRLRVDLDLGFWYDGNINGAPETDTVAIPAFGNLVFDLEERPVGAWVARTGARLRWRRPVTDDGRVLFEATASAARNTAIGASAHSRTWLSMAAGPRIGYAAPIAGRQLPGRLAVDLGAERRFRDGSGYATNLWTGLALDQALDEDWRVGITPRVWTTFQDGQPGEVDPLGRSIGLFVSHRLGPGWLSLSGTLARETADRSSLNWRSGGLSVTYAADVGEDWSGSVRLGMSEARFDEPDGVFLTRREDRTRSAGLSLSHREVSWNGYQPVLMFDWSRTDSNVPLYDRTVASVRVGLNRLF